MAQLSPGGVPSAPMNRGNGAGSNFGGTNAAPVAQVPNQQYLRGPGNNSGDQYMTAGGMAQVYPNQYGAGSVSSGGGSSYPAGSVSTNPDYARQQVMQNTQGRGDATLNDPYYQASLNQLDKVTTGQSAPFTPAIQNQMENRMADATAGSAANQASMLQNQASANGGNVNDPSYQAALRGIDSQRQQANQGNLGDIMTNSALSNFQAQEDAANQLANVRGGQLGEANNQYNQAAGYWAKMNQSGNHINSTNDPTAGFDFSQFYNPGAGAGGPPGSAAAKAGPQHDLVGLPGDPAFGLQQPYGPGGNPNENLNQEDPVNQPYGPMLPTGTLNNTQWGNIGNFTGSKGYDPSQWNSPAPTPNSGLPPGMDANGMWPNPGQTAWGIPQFPLNPDLANLPSPNFPMNPDYSGS